MEVESIRFPPIGPSFRNQYLAGSRGVSTKNLYRANIYANKGTHGISKISLKRHEKERNVNGYVMERGKSTYVYKVPKGFTTKQLLEISRVPRSGSVMRVVQQLNEETLFDPSAQNEVANAAAGDGNEMPPNMDFAKRRVSNDMMDIDRQPVVEPMQNNGGGMAVMNGGGGSQMDMPQQVFEDRFVDAQEFLQDYDDDIMRRLNQLQQDPVEYREADGQIIFNGLVDDGQDLRDPFMLDNGPIFAQQQPLTVEEIRRVAKRRRWSSGSVQGMNVKRNREGAPELPMPAPPSPPPVTKPKKPVPAKVVIGKRERRRSSVGAADNVKRTRQRPEYSSGEVKEQVVPGEIREQQLQVVKRKRQASLSDLRHKQRKARTDKGPRYTADRTVIANAPERVRRNSDEMPPAKSTRSKVKRK